MKKVVRLSESDMNRLVKRIVEQEMDDDTRLNIIEEYGDKIIEVLQSCYDQYGIEFCVDVLESVQGVIHDIGGETFGGPIEY